MPLADAVLAHDLSDISDCLALSNQLQSSPEVEDDVVGSVPDSFDGGIPNPGWPDEDSHSPWTHSQGPRQATIANSRTMNTSP
jgi:hypothetical protein